jgi:hypothetical protein
MHTQDMELKVPLGKSLWYPLDKNLVVTRAGMDMVVKIKILTLARNRTEFVQQVTST